jgi:hypothetical protein
MPDLWALTRLEYPSRVILGKVDLFSFITIKYSSLPGQAACKTASGFKPVTPDQPGETVTSELPSVAVMTFPVVECSCAWRTFSRATRIAGNRIPITAIKANAPTTTIAAVIPIISPTEFGLRGEAGEAAGQAKPGGGGGGVAAAAGGTQAGIAGGRETTIGTINGWEQFGQLTVAPPADVSTSSFWPHLGQLNLISIGFSRCVYFPSCGLSSRRGLRCQVLLGCFPASPGLL